MISKGTNEYKLAQELANNIQRISNYSREYNNSSFYTMFDPFYQFISKIENTGGFASKVATTINEQANPFADKISNVSSKQSWIIACAAVENNITL